MLVLSRKKQQSIVIAENITVTILHCGGNTVRLGITAPAGVGIIRSELLTDQVVRDAAHAKERLPTQFLGLGAFSNKEEQGTESRQDRERQCEMATSG